MMNKKQTYVCPLTTVIKTEVEHMILNGSHGIGGHNPGTIAPPISGAKQGFSFEENDEEEAL
jgi:hypothetical protein